MWKQSLIRGIFVGLVLLLCGCGGGPERTLLRGGTRHLPLLDNRVLRYREQKGASERTYTMQMRYAGGQVVRVFPLLFKGIDLGHCVLRSSGEKVYFATDRPLTAMQTLSEYRQLWVDETAKQGDEWEDDDVGTKTMFDSYETVTVPAGTFERCYKTVTVVQPAFMDSLNAWRDRGELTPDEVADWATDAHDRIVRWFAPGAGLVKEEFNGGEITRELVAIVKPGTGKSDSDTTQTDAE